MASDRDPTSTGRPDAAAVEARGGEYLVVARRYRPQTFDELIGQEQVSRALAGAIVAGRVGHAYLFTGARGVGKTSAARILAKALDCVHGPTPTPCNQCDICQSISRGSDVDVLEIDGASNRGIDEIRQLRQNVGVRPSRARFKIYIIDEVHMLTKEAFNALLKTLEEPPEHVKFIFCTTEPTKIPITILSRCQRFDFAGIRPASIQERLAQIVAAEGATAEPEALALLARRAAGSMRDSQSLLGAIAGLWPRASDGGRHSRHAGHRQRRAVGRPGAPFGRSQCGRSARPSSTPPWPTASRWANCSNNCWAIFAMPWPCSSVARPTISSTPPPASATKCRPSAGSGDSKRCWRSFRFLEQALSRLRTSAQGRTLAEIALVRVASLENLEDISSLVAQLRAGSSGELARARAPWAGCRVAVLPGPAGPPGPGQSAALGDVGSGSGNRNS